MPILDYKLLPYNFDKFQLEAIKSHHKNTLINAGAGSGKTSTILGRILYLLAEKNADPERILVLVFNKNVANEIRERLSEISQLIQKDKKLENQFPELSDKLIKISDSKAQTKKVHTYHSYAFKLARENNKDIVGRTPKISYRNANDLTELFAELFEDNNFLEVANSYFFVRNKNYNFRNIHEDIKSYSEYEKYIKPFGQTMKREQVKSNEELNIANHLFARGVKYIYEDSINDNNMNFRPDFHLIKHDKNNKTIYDVYYEHFGLDKNFNPPPYFKKEDKENYLLGYRKKKEYFEKNNLDYFFTYSYQFSDQTIYKILNSELEKRGIYTSYSDRMESTPTVLTYPPAISWFENLISALSNFKLNELSIEQLIENNKKIHNKDLKNDVNKNFISKVISVFFEKLDSIFNNNDNLASYRSTLAFIEVFNKFYKLYENKLSQQGIDFDDQIIKGKEAKSVISNKEIDHCISDEFQDISIPRAEIIKNLQSNNPKMSLFFVGDDWQSINGFAGSNYRIMTRDFTATFGDYEKIDLKYTYRFNDNVCSITKRFIEQNKDQIKKNLMSYKGAFPKNSIEKKWNISIPLIINYIPNKQNLKPGMKIYHSIYKVGKITNIFLNEDQDRIANIKFKKMVFKLNLSESTYDQNNRELDKIIWDKTFSDEIFRSIKNIIDRIKSSKKTILFINRLKVENYLDDNYTRGLILKIKDYIGCKGNFNNEKLTGGLFKEVSFMTAHGSKGLEADYVVILKCYGNQGFPNSRETDKVLYPFLSHQLGGSDFIDNSKIMDSIKEEEERRLFYVALTRSRNSTYIFTDAENKFIKEIISKPENKNKVKTGEVVEIKTNLKAKKIVKSSYHERVKQIKKKHVNAYKVWTNSEELELLNLYKKQSSIVEIAKRLNRQVGGIKSRLRKLGLIN